MGRPTTPSPIRFWIIHLWVEGFFELFVTVVVAITFYQLGLVERTTALRVISVMTNATVGTITQAPQGNVIKVSYKGTESEYTVDPTTPIFANATGDRSLLVPGAAVFVIASTHDDGKLTSTRLYVEKDGIKPPM